MPPDRAAPQPFRVGESTSPGIGGGSDGICGGSPAGVGSSVKIGVPNESGGMSPGVDPELVSSSGAFTAPVVLVSSDDPMSTPATGSGIGGGSDGSVGSSVKIGVPNESGGISPAL